MRAVDENIRLGWLVEIVTNEVLEQARALALHQVCPRAAHVTATHVAAARTVVPEVRAWGLSGAREDVQALIRRVLKAGCDGATIDWPDWLSV